MADCQNLIIVNHNQPHRCAVGDLSGKHGQVAVRAETSAPRTLVATDSNLPLVGPYTGNTCSITISECMNLFVQFL